MLSHSCSTPNIVNLGVKFRFKLTMEDVDYAGFQASWKNGT